MAPNPASLLGQVLDLRERMVALGSGPVDVHPDQQLSAANLRHYLALRQSDVRGLQEELRRIGLSSLGRSEACALATVDAVCAALSALSGEQIDCTDTLAPSFDEGDALIARRAETLLGTIRPDVGGRVMVTLPSAAAENPQVTLDLREAGMDAARINSAHDDENAWRAMVANVRAAEAKLGKPPIPILLDLEGPNPRTGGLPAGIKSVRVEKGDRVFLTDRHASLDTEFDGVRLSCTLPEVFADCEPGQPVMFDDGSVLARIVSANRTELQLVVEEAGLSGAKLRAGKGINLPETELSLPSVTSRDERTLAFAAGEPEITLIGLSFVRRPADVHACLDAMERIGADRLGLVMKIETRAAFESLPEILLASMRRPLAAVMIARGDLAVELGVVRLAEAQEEILWMCEAAHTPVIWATQVLESLAKLGRATRAEVTDAAMSVRAECVMLNKGPQIARAVRTLDDILRSMREHQTKKRSVLRPLGIARRYGVG